MPAGTAGGSAAASNPSAEKNKSSSPDTGSSDQNATVAPSTAGRSSSSSTPSAPRQIRRRNRLIQSCLECRRRKLKCSKTTPCENCVKFNRDCLFLSPALDQASQHKLTEIKEKVGSIERQLEIDAAERRRSEKSVMLEGSNLILKVEPDEEDEAEVLGGDDPPLDSNVLAVQELAYADPMEADADDDLLDLGIQIGKMRLTERVGGLLRPKLAEEISSTFQASGQDALPSQPTASLTPEVRNQYLKSFKPGPNFIAPSSGFFFGSIPQHSSLFDYLPSRLMVDRIINQYFVAVHPIARMVHKPSFMKDYHLFWEHVSTGIPPPNSMQAMIFAAVFSGVVSMDDDFVHNNFGVAKTGLVDNFRTATEMALGRANFLKSTKFQTLQSLVMYLIPLCREELSRAHSVLVGAAIRAGECLGLHRDPSQFSLSPLETHMRRILWHQLCFLDLRTCEAQGPRLTIRLGDYDTKIPLNVDDEDLTGPNPPTADADRWTDMTLTNLRFECNEFMRSLWTERTRIEQKKATLQTVMKKVEAAQTRLSAKYEHLLRYDNPLHKCTKVVKDILTARFIVMILFIYKKMPDRLHNLLITTCTWLTERVNMLQTQPDLHTWSWYSGAFSQQHAAFLILVEAMQRPNRPDAPRIWAAVDVVFGCDPSDPPEQKGLKIVREVHQKAALYQEHRRARAPAATRNSPAPVPASIPDQANEFTLIPQPDNEAIELASHRLPISTQIPTQMLQQQAIQGQPSFPMSQYGQAATSSQQQMGSVTAPPSNIQQEMVFAGVADGEALWALPPQNDSPEASSSNSSTRQASTGASDSDQMVDIDWDALDTMFPPDQFGFDPMNPFSSTFNPQQPPQGQYSQQGFGLEEPNLGNYSGL